MWLSWSAVLTGHDGPSCPATTVPSSIATASGARTVRALTADHGPVRRHRTITRATRNGAGVLPHRP